MPDLNVNAKCLQAKSSGKNLICTEDSLLFRNNLFVLTLTPDKAQTADSALLYHICKFFIKKSVSLPSVL